MKENSKLASPSSTKLAEENTPTTAAPVASADVVGHNAAVEANIPPGPIVPGEYGDVQKQPLPPAVICEHDDTGRSSTLGGGTNSDAKVPAIEVVHTSTTSTVSTGGQGDVLYIALPVNQILQGDAFSVLQRLPSNSVDEVVTSPPYFGQRDYEVDGQIGVETTWQEYLRKLCDVFDEVKRVLKETGTCWVNLGDTYGAKCLMQIPSRFSIEMTNRGWNLRNEIIWHKPNCMPHPAKDKFTPDFEKVFLFTKSEAYYFEQQLEPLAKSSIGRAKYGWHCDRANNRTGVHVEKMGGRFCNPKGRNMRSVWSIPTRGFKGAHFATYPEALCERPIKAGCPIGGIVLDPFAGSGTTLAVAKRLGRKYVGIELNPEYCRMIEERLSRQ